MLEKMGWTSGKGLGAKEQGVTDHIRVKHKDDQAGLGFSKDKQDNLWTETQQNFSQLLQQLRAGDSPSAAEKYEDLSLSGKSLELKSQQSRARVHYRKFTRGKDVNRYSAKDLANIFGKKDLAEVPAVESPTESSAVESVGTEDTTAGVLTIKGGSMEDYFRSKLPLQLAKKFSSEKEESESENERYVGFGFSGNSSNLDTPRKRKSQFYVDGTSEATITEQVQEQTPKKRKLQSFAFENPGLDLVSQESGVPTNKMEVPRPVVALECIPQSQDQNPEEVDLSMDQSLEKTPKKKKKKKEKVVGFVNDALNLEAKDVDNYSEAFEVSREVLGLANDALDLTDEASGKKRVTFNDTVEYNTDRVKNKKSSAKLDKFEVVDDKSKKKKKAKSILVNGESSFVNEALDVEVVNEEVCDNEANERKSRGKRKREKKSNLETIEEVEEKVEGNSEDLVQDTSDNLGDMTLESPKKKQKKKKKKSKDRDKEEEVEVEKAGMDVDESGNKENFSDSKSEGLGKRKKKKSKEIEQVVTEESKPVDVEGLDAFLRTKKGRKSQLFKSLFKKTPVVNFVGSNISKIEGYNVSASGEDFLDG
uniref:G-patch domain-contaning protein n=1 Tax=Glyptapanteles indiensis TaxID=92994 RepID=B7S972_GLYIN|nr:G-patch domain-contaning protein [Glyptapanteles indiensis]